MVTINSEALEQLDSVSAPYLREISESRDNSLRVVVEEAGESTKGARRFELRWSNYVAYLVAEGGVGSTAQDDREDEAYNGRTLRLYSKSHFLEHLARDTGRSPATLSHYKLICRNRQIDVAAHAAPEIRVLNRPMEKKQPVSRHIGGIIGPY